jgi:exonuclease III
MAYISWKILNWNIRGVNDDKKWPLIMNKITESNAQILCFQETKRSSFDLPYIRNFCPRKFDQFAFLPSIGRSGGILTVWCSSEFSGSVVFSNAFSLSVEFCSSRSEDTFIVTNIYGPCQHERKLEFISWLHDIQMPDDSHWLLTGDFNLIRSIADRNKPGAHIPDILKFNEAISNLGIIEIPLKDIRFTWSNMQDPPLLARLD